MFCYNDLINSKMCYSNLFGCFFCLPARMSCVVDTPCCEFLLRWGRAFVYYFARKNHFSWQMIKF